LVIVGLMLLSLAANYFARQPGADSPVPSITNRGPRGAAVLAAWLEQTGHRAIVHDAPLTDLAADTKVLVIAAPALEELREEEVQSVKRFVEAGGTLVYLSSRNGAQPALHRWLDLHGGEVSPLVSSQSLEDVGGSTVDSRFPGGLFTGVKSLRLSADRMVRVDRKEAVPVTEHGAVWWLPEGRGEVWIAGGPDLIENARLELADNALFWSRLASRGPLTFDEYHHHHGATQLPVNLLTSGLQLLLLAALLFWARGTRMGPPRDEPLTAHRSALEYVRAMAALTANAKVDDALVEGLRRDFRRRLEEELGIPQSWGWAEAARAWAGKTGGVEAQLTAAATLTEFVPAARAFATLEQTLR
jgi:hypothetical protein